MIVEITNLTDGPGRDPKEVELFGRTLSPGDSIKVYAALVDKKTRSIEEAGYISIGQIPPWYAAFKAKNKGRQLTQEELEAQLVTPRPVIPAPVVTTLTMVDQALTRSDTVLKETMRSFESLRLSRTEEPKKKR